jgi:hypothetical protein
MGDRFDIWYAKEVSAQFLMVGDIQFPHELPGRLIFDVKWYFLQNAENIVRKPLQHPPDLPVKIISIVLIHVATLITTTTMK